jgi:serine/threonine protein kinase
MEPNERSPRLDPGQLLSARYRIVSFIGKGGMGEVYEAVDTKLSRPVALKTLLHASDEIDELVRRFDREAVAIARINHPHIVQIYDSGYDQKEYYLVMERLYGDTLNKLIDNQRLSNPGWISDIGAQIAEAVHAAHKKGVIHRDIKPANIFIEKSDQNVDKVKVLDFGLAKLLDIGQVLTRTGQVFGTPTYMAPEFLRDIKNASNRSDIYSIGCVLYEMLTGRPPFEAGSRAELLQRVLGDRPAPIDTFRDDVPKSLVKLLESTLEKQPAKRLPNANLLALALREIASRYDENDRRNSTVPIRLKSPPKRSLAEVTTLLDDTAYSAKQENDIDLAVKKPESRAEQRAATTSYRYYYLLLAGGIILILFFVLAGVLRLLSD